MRQTAAVALAAILCLAAVAAADSTQDFSISGAEYRNTTPRVCVNPETGDMLVVWLQLQLSSAEPARYRLFAGFCRYDGDGFFLTHKTDVGAIFEGQPLSDPAIAWDPAAHSWLLAVPVRLEGDTPTYQIRCRRIDRDGYPLGRFAIATDNESDNFSPQLISTHGSTGAAPSGGKGRFIMLWQRSGGAQGLYAVTLGKGGKSLHDEHMVLEPDAAAGADQTIRPQRLIRAVDGTLLAAVRRTTPDTIDGFDRGLVLRLTADGEPLASAFISDYGCETADVVSLSRRLSYGATGARFQIAPQNARTRLFVGAQLKPKGEAVAPLNGGAAQTVLVRGNNGACELAWLYPVLYTRSISARGVPAADPVPIATIPGLNYTFAAERLPGSDRILMVYSLDLDDKTTELRAMLFTEPQP